MSVELINKNITKLIVEKYVTFKNASKSWNINAVFEGIGQKTDQDKLAL